MINIYNPNGSILLRAELTSAAKREEEMSKSDYITLSWSLPYKVSLPVGAYITHTYWISETESVTRNFLLLEPYAPEQSSEQEWKYTPEFQHPKMILSKIPFYIRTQNSQNETVKQTEWAFVGNTKTLAARLAEFLNDELQFGKAGWQCVVSDNIDNTINVSFSNNDFLSSLTAICNALDDNCEWHLDYDTETIYIGKVLIGSSPVLLKVGENIGPASLSSNSDGYYNQFVIKGGTRNITQPNSKGENIASGDIRLQLDAGSGTITILGTKRSYTIDEYSTLDIRSDKKTIPALTKVLTFEEVFPSLYTYVYNVRSREKYVISSDATGTDKRVPIKYNEDGSVAAYKTFTVWYMRLAYPTVEKIEGKTPVNTTVDDGVTHYWYDFEITNDLKVNGKTVSCSFEPNFETDALSTPLAGRGSNGDYVGFELSYHEEAYTSHTSDDVSSADFKICAGDYEIIYQNDNDVYIPSNASDMIVPKGEDLPSLRCNKTVLYNIAMAESYYTDAKARLLDAATEEIESLFTDTNNYTCKSYPHIFAASNPRLRIGQYVKFNDNHGYSFETRVLKLSTNIDYDCVQSITLGNQAIKGTISKLKEDVQSIIAGGNGGNGGGYTVSQFTNMLANYGSRFFLRKDIADTALSPIRFAQGATFGPSGTAYGIGADGMAVLEGILSDGFTAGALGSGMCLTMEPESVEGGGKYAYLEVDRLLVRKAAEFLQIVIRELKHVGGEVLLSPASMKCIKVMKVTGLSASDTVYRCYFRKTDNDGTYVDNPFAVGDLVRCQRFNITDSSDNARTYYYWRKCVAVGTDYIDLSSTDYDTSTTNNTPQAGDEMVQLGSATDTTRQSAILLSSYGTDAPSIKLYRGVSTYSLADKEVFEVSATRVLIIADELYYTTDGGKRNVKEAVTTIEATAEGLKTSVTDHETRISTNTKNIAALDSSVSDLGTEVKTFSSTMEQTARKISLEVTETTTGLKNVITGTAFRSWDTIPQVKDNYPAVRLAAGGVAGSDCAVLEVSGLSSSQSSYCGVKQQVTLTPGKTYTYSFWAKVETVCDASAYSRLYYETTKTGIRYIAIPATATTEWTRFEWTFECPEDATDVLIETAIARNGRVLVCRQMLMEGDTYEGWSLSPDDTTESGALESKVIRTGIDIASGKITATADKFEVKNTDGDVTASVNADGLLEVANGLFTGFVMKKPTTLTPDNVDSMVTTAISNGYVQLDYTKTGSYVIFSGAMAAKFGSNLPTVVLPTTGNSASSLNVSLAVALQYVGQTFIVANESDTTVNILAGGTIQTIDTSSTWIANGKYAVLRCEATYSSGKLGVVWNGYIGK